MYAPFPWKPRGMHWRTYDRLRLEAEEAGSLPSVWPSIHLDTAQRNA
jgi:hypothetical protein